MRSFDSRALLEQLQSDVRGLIATATIIKNEDPGILLEQPAPGKWNVIQILEHLNSYGDYYLPELEKALNGAAPAVGTFRSGWLGNYFTNLMLPRDGRIRSKMKAFRNHTPAFHADARPVMEEFLRQQQRLLALLELAERKDTGSTRIPISISRLIRLKTGDTFRFLIAHEQRHFLQIRNTLDSVRSPAGRFQAAHQGG